MIDMNTITAVARPLDALADDINEQRQLGINALQRSIDHFRRCGELLNLAKSRLDHGEWLPWLEANWEGSASEANRYMKLARKWGQLVSRVDHARVRDLDGLSLRSALALLAAPDDIGPAPKPQLPSESHLLIPPITDYLPMIVERRQQEPYRMMIADAVGKERLAKIHAEKAERLHDEAVNARIEIDRQICGAISREHCVDMQPCIGITAGMSDADVHAHYHRTAPVEDLKFFLRVAEMSDDLREDAEALLVQSQTLKRPDFDRAYKRLKERWRDEANERQRLAEPMDADPERSGGCRCDICHHSGRYRGVRQHDYPTDLVTIPEGGEVQCSALGI